MSGEVKVMQTLRGLAQRYLGVGFFLGFFLVLLTYFTVSEQFAITAPNAVSRLSRAHVAQPGPVIEEKKSSPVTEKATKPHDPPENFTNHEEEKKVTIESKQLDSSIHQTPQKKPVCDVQNPFTSDICDVDGDVRIHGSSGTILIAPSDPTGNPDAHEWKIRPYSRKHMTSIQEVTVKELHAIQEAPACAVKSPVPAAVFALGGLTGNYWHDFSDVMIPLYLATRRFDGEVQLLVENIQGWYIGKYKAILDRLSRYEIIDFDKDDRVRCHPGAVVGIRMHKEFSIDPSKSPEGYSMVDFTKFLRATFALPRDAPVRLTDGIAKKPRLMIISRRHPRMLVNLQDIVRLAERVGFDVVVGDPPFNVNVGEFAQDVNSCDALVGVHGAGLTNSLFLPTGAVFVQIVPYGNLEHMSRVDFGDPAIDMRLKYLVYSSSAEESTLVDSLGRDHPAVRDPDAIHKSGWGKVAEYYLGKQDIKLDLRRFEPVLAKALDLLRESKRK